MRPKAQTEEGDQVSQEQIAKAIEASGVLPSNGNDQQDRQIASDLAAVLAPLFAEAQAEALREAADDFERRVEVTVQMAAEQPGSDYSKEATQNAAGVKIAASVLRHKAAMLTAQADPEGRALVAGIHERKKAQ